MPLLRINENDIVVETGCGTGTGIELILNSCPSIRKRLANDISEHMLERLRQNNYQLTNTDFFLASNENLPYKSATCDHYISNLSFLIVERPEEMVQEAY